MRIPITRASFSLSSMKSRRKYSCHAPDCRLLLFREFADVRDESLDLVVRQLALVRRHFFPCRWSRSSVSCASFASAHRGEAQISRLQGFSRRRVFPCHLDHGMPRTWTCKAPRRIGLRAQGATRQNSIPTAGTTKRTMRTDKKTSFACLLMRIRLMSYLPRHRRVGAQNEYRSENVALLPLKSCD